jgi:maltodextrin utilization protein YvdJ
MAPLVAALMGKGLTLLADAVLAKGKDVIEDKLGIKLDTASSLDLQKAQFQHEEFLLQIVKEGREQELKYQQTQEEAVTKRWESDMMSDSWLSKNIRPVVLIYLLTAYTIFSLGSVFKLDISPAYVSLLGEWGMLVMGAYFGGRSLEKIVALKEIKK